MSEVYEAVHLKSKNSSFTQIFEWRTRNISFVTIFPWCCTEVPEYSTMLSDRSYMKTVLPSSLRSDKLSINRSMSLSSRLYSHPVYAPRSTQKSSHLRTNTFSPSALLTISAEGVTDQCTPTHRSTAIHRVRETPPQTKRCNITQSNDTYTALSNTHLGTVNCVSCVVIFFYL